MSPHTPDSPPRGETRSDNLAGRALRRLRRLGADVRASVDALVDSVVGTPSLAPAVVPVAPSNPRRRSGGGR